MRALPAGQAATLLGDYELVLELASHDTTVLLGRRTGPRSFSRWVTIRYVGPFLGDEGRVLERIDRDIERASLVRHPYVLPIHEAGALANGRYVVSDYVEGGTLEELLESGPLPVAIAVALVADLLSGLEAVGRAEDAQGRPLMLVHGRLSPKSVVVGLDGRARLADLGLEAVPRKGESGSNSRQVFHYQAPEVLAGERTTSQSDVFSAGMILYELLRGAHPIAHARDPRSMSRALSEPLPLLSIVAPRVDVALAEIVARALSSDPSLRFRSAETFATAIERAAMGASPREVGAFTTSCLGPAVDDRRRLASEWVRSHAAAKGERSISTVARAHRRARRALRRRRSGAILLLVAGLVALGAGAGLIAWWISL